jgi:hypothetical protein
MEASVGDFDDGLSLVDDVTDDLNKLADAVLMMEAIFTSALTTSPT